MTNEEYLNKIREHGAELRKDPVKLLEFMKSLGAFKKRRVIEGEEREQVLTMRRLLGPGTSSNNQHVWTESWRVGNVEYNIHSNDKFEELEEVIDDEPSH
jgi:hypothetical protein